MSRKLVDARALLGQAIEKAGGVRALARELDWNVGKVSSINSGDRISPYRARQVTHFLGMSPQLQDEAMFSSLAELAKADAERSYWLELIGRSTLSQNLDDRVDSLIEAAWDDCQKQWGSMKKELTAEDKVDDFRNVVKAYVRAAASIGSAKKVSKKAG